MQSNVYIYYAMLIGVVLTALFRGNREQQKIIFACGIASILSSITSMNFSWDHVSYELFFIDVLLLVYFFYVCIFSSQYWPYWITGWQLISVMGHVQKFLFSDILPEPYSVLVRFISYMIVLLIFSVTLFGTKFSHSFSGGNGEKHIAT